MTISCPFCSQQIAFDLAFVGKNIKCPKCQRILSAPQASQLPPEYQEELKAEQERLLKRQQKQQQKEEKLRRQGEESLRRQKADEQRKKQKQEWQKHCEERDKQQRLEQLASQRKPTTQQTTALGGTFLMIFGVIVLMIGFIGMLATMSLDTTVESHNMDIGRVYNTGLVAEKLNQLLIFAATTVVGAIFAGVGSLLTGIQIIASREKHE